MPVRLQSASALQDRAKHVISTFLQTSRVRYVDHHMILLRHNGQWRRAPARPFGKLQAAMDEGEPTDRRSRSVQLASRCRHCKRPPIQPLHDRRAGQQLQRCGSAARRLRLGAVCKDRIASCADEFALGNSTSRCSNRATALPTADADARALSGRDKTAGLGIAVWCKIRGDVATAGHGRCRCQRSRGFCIG
jgi:hypothetical protein